MRAVLQGSIQRRLSSPEQDVDGMGRKNRLLKELPIAPPLKPRQPRTAAERAPQEENDRVGHND